MVPIIELETLQLKEKQGIPPSKENNVEIPLQPQARRIAEEINKLINDNNRLRRLNEKLKEKLKELRYNVQEQV